MADIKISQLGSAITVDDSDIVPVVSGGNTLKATAAQLKEHAIGNTSISGIGDGSVTGAISALNSDKQPKTLATSITVDGTPQTTVEGALGAINTDLGSTKQALTNKADKSALTNISVTGTTNNTGSTIAKGTFFLVNGIIVKAILDIANGATFTESNITSLPKGALNEFATKTYGLSSASTALLNNEIKKMGDVVTLYLRMYTTKSDSLPLLVGYLPSGCRPSRKYSVATNITSPTMVAAGNILGGAYIVVDTDGSVTYQYAVNLPNAEIYNEALITFIV